jgi:ribonuclease G
MGKTLLIHSGIAELQAASLRNGVLEKYWSETLLHGAQDDGDAPRLGDIVLGRVRRVVAGVDAAFIDIGEERDAFLAARDADPVMRPRENAVAISRLVHEGEALLVQVTKDAAEGKGPRVGVRITLPGRLVVFSPGEHKVSLSKKIEDETERQRLADIVSCAGGEHGFVVRTVAAGASEEDLKAEIESLKSAWSGILALKARAEPPEILYRDANALTRFLRDHVAADIDEVIVSPRRLWNEVQEWAVSHAPDVTGRIALHDGKAPLFAVHGIEDDVAALADSHVALPGGGHIVIGATEALTAIDVNSGSHPARGSLEATALMVDSEAVEVIARQISLRALSGLIVIDFIPVRDEAAFSNVIEHFRAALKRLDIVAEITRVPGMNLVTVTRKRERSSLTQRLSEPCPVCDGDGRQPTAEAIALAALREVERTHASAPGKPIAIRVGAEVASWFESRAGLLRRALEQQGIGGVRVFPEPARSRESFSVETGGNES